METIFLSFNLLFNYYIIISKVALLRGNKIINMLRGHLNTLKG